MSSEDAALRGDAIAMVDSSSNVIKKQIASSLWFSSSVICLSSFMFGYTLAALNSCLVMGAAGSESACYNGDDNNSNPCPPGTIYDDLKLSTGKYCSYVPFFSFSFFNIKIL